MPHLDRKMRKTTNNRDLASLVEKVNEKENMKSASPTDDMGGKNFLARILYNSLNYFIVGLLFNGLLFSFYIVMVFSEHPECMSSSGRVNVTKKFIIFFQIGFIATIVDMGLSVCYETTVRVKSYFERDRHEYCSKSTLQHQEFFHIATWVMRGIWTIITFLQFANLTLRSSEECTMMQFGGLRVEKEFFEYLIKFQLAKLVFLSSWHLILN